NKSIRDVVSSIDPSQPVFDARPMIDRVQETWGTQRLLSFLFSIFAGLALLLATIGLYGLLAYTTLKRVREIGIRLALGARPAQIRVLVLSHGLQLLLIGSVFGLVAAFALSRALQSVLFEVKGIDPRIYLSVGALLFAATFLASWIPARRASGLDPIPVSPAELVDYETRAHSFEKLGAFSCTNFNLAGEDKPERISGATVTAGVLPLLGVSPIKGRFFEPEECTLGRDNVVIISA